MSHLHRLTTSACRCASTSTSRPCLHASVPVSLAARRQLHTKPAPRRAEPAAKHVGAASTTPAFEYTAPLWEKPWFSQQSGRTNWGGWLAASRTPTAPPPTEPKPDPRGNGRFFNPARSSRLPAPAGGSKAKAKSVGDELLMGFIQLRGPGHEFLRAVKEPLGYELMLEAARAKGLPIVLRQLEQDLNEVFADRAAGGEVVEQVADRGEHQAEERVAEDLVVAPEQAADPVRPRRTRFLSPVKTMTHLLSVGTRDMAFLDSLSLTAVASADASSLAPIAHDKLLADLWEAYSSSVELDLESTSDLLAALSFIHLLASPSLAPSQSPPQLGLALKVLQKLLVTAVSPDTVALAPTYSAKDGEPLPREVILQVILLRTVAGLALSAEHPILAVKALISLGAVRNAHAASGASGEDDADVDLLEEAVEGLVGEMRIERALGYAPPLAKASAREGGHETRLGQVTALLAGLLPRWISPSQEGGVSDGVDALLQAFADELAARERWDLAGHLWSAWRAHKWQLDSHQHKLLRWFGGEAPFRTYGTLAPDDAPAPTSASPSTRVISATKFERFAQSFDAGAVAEGWTYQQKSDWIALACESRAATEKTRAAARRAWGVWSDPKRDSARRPFALSPAAMLALIRTSLAKFDFVARDDPARLARVHFARQVIDSYVRHLTRPDSAFAAPVRKGADGAREIAHADLTALASAYALVGEHEAVSEVFRRMLKQRMVPDSQDVGLLLSLAAGRDAPKAAAFVDLADELGIELKEEHLHNAIASVAKHARQTGEDVGAAVAKVVEVAKRAGHLNADARARLGKHARNAASEDRVAAVVYQGVFAEPTVAALQAQLAGFAKPERKGRRGTAAPLTWRQAATLHGAATRAGVRDPASLRMLLVGLLRVERSLVSRHKGEVQAAMAEAVDGWLEESGEADAGVDGALAGVVVRAVLKGGEWGRMREVGEVLGRKAGVVGEAEMEKAVRWGIGQLGRQAWETEGGWWAEQWPVEQK